MVKITITYPIKLNPRKFPTIYGTHAKHRVTAQSDLFSELARMTGTTKKLHNLLCVLLHTCSLSLLTFQLSDSFWNGVDLFGEFIDFSLWHTTPSVHHIHTQTLHITLKQPMQCVWVCVYYYMCVYVCVCVNVCKYTFICIVNTGCACTQSVMIHK